MMGTQASLALRDQQVLKAQRGSKDRRLERAFYCWWCIKYKYSIIGAKGKNRQKWRLRHQVSVQNSIGQVSEWQQRQNFSFLTVLTLKAWCKRGVKRIQWFFLYPSSFLLHLTGSLVWLFLDDWAFDGSWIWLACLLHHQVNKGRRWQQSRAASVSLMGAPFIQSETLSWVNPAALFSWTNILLVVTWYTIYKRNSV